MISATAANQKSLVNEQAFGVWCRGEDFKFH